MIRHLAVGVVFAVVASSCCAQDQKVPFLQIEHENSPSLQQGWSDSVTGIDLMAAETSTDSLFEPGYTRNPTANTRRHKSDRVIDRDFLIVNGISAGTLVMDYATSRHCVAVHECVEANPLMPSSLGGMIFVGALSIASVSGYSYALKKRHYRGIWAVAPVTNAGIHVWGMWAGLKSW